MCCCFYCCYHVPGTLHMCFHFVLSTYYKVNVVIPFWLMRKWEEISHSPIRQSQRVADLGLEPTPLESKTLCTTRECAPELTPTPTASRISPSIPSWKTLLKRQRNYQTNRHREVGQKEKGRDRRKIRQKQYPWILLEKGWAVQSHKQGVGQVSQGKAKLSEVPDIPTQNLTKGHISGHQIFSFRCPYLVSKSLLLSKLSFPICKMKGMAWQ